MTSPLLPLSLLVLTRNEAANIARCLDSVPFAAEKLVVDCGSSDDTVAIARSHGATVLHQDWLGFGLQRRFATSQARHPWILFLDADEWLSEELVAQMQRQLPALMASDIAGAFLLRSAWFMGARMRWYRPLARERHARFYHRDRALWSDATVHESLQLNGASRVLTAPLLHAYTPTLWHRLGKDAYYAELRVRQWYSQRRRSYLWMAPVVFLSTFLKDYILRLAVLDGRRGYAAAHLAAAYSAYKRLRYHEVVMNPESLALVQESLRQAGVEPRE